MSVYHGLRDFFVPQGYSVQDYIPVSLTVSLDGPYGHPPNFAQYDDVVLVSGGIGVTPCKSVFESLYLSYMHDYVHGRGEDLNALTSALPSLTQSSSGHAVGASPSSVSGLSLSPAVSPSMTPDHGPSRVHMVCVSRDVSLFQYMAPTLSQLPVGPFAASLVCTTAPVSASSGDSAVEASVDAHVLSRVQYGRIDVAAHLRRVLNGVTDPEAPSPLGDDLRQLEGMDEIAMSSSLSSLSSSSRDRRVLVFACGPAPLVREMELLSVAEGWDFHKEEFQL